MDHVTERCISRRMVALGCLGLVALGISTDTTEAQIQGNESPGEQIDTAPDWADQSPQSFDLDPQTDATSSWADLSPQAQRLEARVDATLEAMYARYPNTREIATQAAGMLIIPVFTKASFLFGGAYGRGALRIGNETVDHYSAVQGSYGLQIGAQQYSHVIFFMTREALDNFRTGAGWDAGADIGATLLDEGATFKTTTKSIASPVLYAIFGQAGFFAGASIQGIKYSRIRL